MIKIKRAYETPNSSDGYRILVDRLWPRGLNKVDAMIDLWMKEIAPSTELRKWFSHDPEKWLEFRDKYAKELEEPVRYQCLSKLRSLASEGEITLLFAAKDIARNNAVVLEYVLTCKLD